MIEQTLIMVKPDGVVKGLIGDIVKRFEKINLKIVGMKMVLADERLADQHYLVTEEWANALGNRTRKAYKKKGMEFTETNMEFAQRIKEWNVNFLREGPVVALVIEGPHAVELGRKIVGHTEPRQAQPGTIRGDHALESYMISDIKKRPIRNLVHASGSVEEAQREIALWFTNQEVYKYSGLHDNHIL